MTIEIHSKKEILCITYSVWGHARPLTALAALISQEPFHHVTLLCIPFLYDRVFKELVSHFPHKTPKEIDEFVSVIAVTANNAEISEMFREEYHATLTAALSTLSVKCGKSGNVRTIPAPNIAIGDIMGYAEMSIARATLPKGVKLLTFSAPSAYSCLIWCGPEKYGGFGDLEAKTVAEMQKSGTDIITACNSVWYGYDGSIINAPGLLRFFDYEKFPQTSQFSPMAVLFYLKSFIDFDGAIVMSSTAIEPEAIRVLKQWFADDDRPFYAIGPLLPLEHSQNGHNDLVTGGLSNEKSQILEFLDASLVKHGEKSLVYISFGTLFWSSRPEMIFSLIDELIAAGIPFLFTHASARSAMPEDVKEKIETSGLGLLSTWSPQKNVLAHPVTGWFVSHCGQNSTLEAVTYGVPIIAWPFEYDQPLNAMLISLVHGIGYELLQVRTGERGLKKPYRCASEDSGPKGEESAWRAEMRAVLANARGADGEKKRANILKMRERFVEGWQEGGEALNELRTLLKLAESNNI